MPRNTLPVKLNEVKTGVVVDILHNGMGVVLVNENYPVKITNAFMGEKIRYRLTQVDRLSAYGEVVEILVAHPERIDAGKDYLLDAGVAPYINLSYAGQLQLKQWQVQQAFGAVGLTPTIAPTIGAKQPAHYRNKTVVPIRRQAGAVMTGFFDRKVKTQLVPMQDYYLNDSVIDQTVGIVREVVAELDLAIYDDATKQGALQYVMVRRGYYSHELMVVLVSYEPDLPGVEQLTQRLVERLPELTSLILNYNPRTTNQQLTGDNRVLWGQAAIHDTLLGHDFIIGPNSFYQVNPETTETLYQLAARLGQLQPTDVAIDAYSGIGTIGLSIADQVAKVYGVEVVERAVADAQINIKNNQITNAEYIAADAPEQMHSWRQVGLQPDVVFVDPPRRGLTEKLMDAVAYMAPKRMVYVSCNPVTMARDIKYMLNLGYHLEGPIRPLDQFPQTAHVECVAALVQTKS